VAMVDRVGQTPQLGGKNLGELVAVRQSQQELLRSVSGPPATENRPSAPEPEAEQASEDEKRASEAQRLEARSSSVRKVSKANDFTQVREVVSQSIDEFRRDSGRSVQAPPPVPQRAASAETPGSRGEVINVVA